MQLEIPFTKSDAQNIMLKSHCTIKIMLLKGKNVAESWKKSYWKRVKGEWEWKCLRKTSKRAGLTSHSIAKRSKTAVSFQLCKMWAIRSTSQHMQLTNAKCSHWQWENFENFFPQLELATLLPYFNGTCTSLIDLIFSCMISDFLQRIEYFYILWHRNLTKKKSYEMWAPHRLQS